MSSVPFADQDGYFLVVRNLGTMAAYNTRAIFEVQAASGAVSGAELLTHPQARQCTGSPPVLNQSVSSLKAFIAAWIRGG
jgi:hypothetical protein